MENLLHKIAHLFYLNDTEEVIIFNQSKNMEMNYKRRCLKCGN